jgi:hypothetical protein
MRNAEAHSNYTEYETADRGHVGRILDTDALIPKH